MNRTESSPRARGCQAVAIAAATPDTHSGGLSSGEVVTLVLGTRTKQVLTTYCF